MRSAFRSLPRTLLLPLAVAAAIAGGCSGDDSNPTSPNGGGGGAADVVIDIVANNGASSYAPSPDTVSVGQTVAWKNTDSMTHTATADGAPAAFNTGNVPPGNTSAPIAMTTPGSYPYHCSLHPGMTGTLVVKP